MKNRKRAPQPVRRSPSDTIDSAADNVPASGGGGSFAWCVFVVVTAVVMAFGTTVTFDFVNWDDPTNVTENPFLNPPSWAGLARLWSAPYAHLYVPLTYTSLALDAAVGGGRAWVFHLHNVLLHAVSSALVLGLVYALLTEWAGRRGEAQSGSAARATLAAATIGALVFALHPLQAEPVSWVTGRKDVLGGMLALLATWLYMRGTDGGRSVAWQGAAWGAFLLALLAKPGAVALPAGLLVMDVAMARETWRRAAVRLTPWFLLSAAWAIFLSDTQQMPAHALAHDSWMNRALIVAHSVWFYVLKVFVPWPTAPIYPHTPAGVAASVWAWVALAGLVGLLALVLWRRGVLLAGAALAAAGVLPVLGLVPFFFQVFSTVADRYAYASLAGVALLVAAGVRWILLRDDGRHRGVVVGLAAVVLVALASLAVAATLPWRDSVALWTHGTVQAPESADAWVNLGTGLSRAKRNAEAEAAYARAVQLNPRHGEAWYNLGVEQMNRGDLAAALQSYGRAMEEHKAQGYNDERVYQVNVNWGVTLMRAGRVEEGVARLRDALAWNPDSFEAHFSLYQALERLGRRQEARTHLDAAQRINPEQTAALLR